MAETIPWPQEPQLLKKLQSSGRRFVVVMETLIAKYNRPFAEDKLVHIATLTYETPEGLREWGGRIVTQDIFQNIQIALEKEGYSVVNIPQRPLTDVRSSGFDESLVQRNGDVSLKDDSLRSLPENGLDVKHVTRVDVILEDDHPRVIMLDRFSKRKTPKLPKMLLTKDSPKALRGCSGSGPRKNDGIPVKPTSVFQGPQDTRMVAMPPNQSLLDWRARRNFSLGNTESAQDLTLSDIYVEMLCSLSKCLPSQKVGLISTKKYISKVWFPKMRKLNITLTMQSHFLKISQKFQVIVGEKNNLIYKDYKQNFLPCSEPDIVVKDRALLNTESSSLPLKGSLPNRSTQESPSRTKDFRQAIPSLSQSHVESQSPATPSSCLPPALTSAKERFQPLQQGIPGRDVLGQERHLSRSLVVPRMLQTPKNVPLSQERLNQKHSASNVSETCPKTGFPREKVPKAEKFLPFCMEQAPCQNPDMVDSIFDKYSQEVGQWSQELIFLKKSGYMSKVLTWSKCEDSLEGLGSCDDPQEPQKAASPFSVTRNSLCETVTLLHCAASPRAISKGDCFFSTKKRKVSSSQTWDHFSPSKMKDKEGQRKLPPQGWKGRDLVFGRL